MSVNLYFNPVQQQGRWELQKLPMIASVAMTEGGAVYAVGDGTHTKVTNSTTKFRGILVEVIVATDDDYATSGKLKGVWVPKSPEALAEFAVGAGTFTVADEGKSVKFNDYQGLAVDTAGIQAEIVKYKSSTRGTCRFNLDIV